MVVAAAGVGDKELKWRRFLSESPILPIETTNPRNNPLQSHHKISKPFLEKLQSTRCPNHPQPQSQPPIAKETETNQSLKTLILTLPSEPKTRKNKKQNKNFLLFIIFWCLNLTSSISYGEEQNLGFESVSVAVSLTQLCCVHSSVCIFSLSLKWKPKREREIICIIFFFKKWLKA